MPISTKDYLRRKHEIQKSIEWYDKNILLISQQQDRRLSALESLRDELNILEKEYRTNG